MANKRMAVARTGVTRPPGWAGMVVGVMSILSAVAVGIISFTPADPPSWFRIGAFWVLILAIPLSIALGVTARQDRLRVWGWIGAGLGGLSLAALVIMTLVAE